MKTNLFVLVAVLLFSVAVNAKEDCFTFLEQEKAKSTSLVLGFGESDDFETASSMARNEIIKQIYVSIDSKSIVTGSNKDILLNDKVTESSSLILSDAKIVKRCEKKNKKQVVVSVDKSQLLSKMEHKVSDLLRQIGSNTINDEKEAEDKQPLPAQEDVLRVVFSSDFQKNFQLCRALDRCQLQSNDLNGIMAKSKLPPVNSISFVLTGDDLNLTQKISTLLSNHGCPVKVSKNPSKEFICNAVCTQNTLSQVVKDMLFVTTTCNVEFYYKEKMLFSINLEGKGGGGEQSSAYLDSVKNLKVL